VSVERGTAALLVRRRQLLAQGAEPIGWKIGFNVPTMQEQLGLDRPLAGFLTNNSLLEDGAEVSLAGGPLVVESEVAVELGEDARTIAALLPALEVADPPDLEQDLEHLPPRRRLRPARRDRSPRCRAHPRERRGTACHPCRAHPRPPR
jgi:hypothetical protein